MSGIFGLQTASDNYFYKAVILHIGQLGVNGVFDSFGDFKASEIASVG
jgi:hypothetical protein